MEYLKEILEFVVLLLRTINSLIQVIKIKREKKSMENQK